MKKTVHCPWCGAEMNFTVSFMALWCLFGNAVVPEASPEFIALTCAIVASGALAGGR